MELEETTFVDDKLPIISGLSGAIDLCLIIRLFEKISNYYRPHDCECVCVCVCILYVCRVCVFVEMFAGSFWINNNTLHHTLVVSQHQWFALCCLKL